MGETIKSFLVGLGFGVDDASLAKFNKAIVNATIKVTALYASIQLTAAGIFKSITSIASGFEQMGYEYRIIAPLISRTLILRRAMLDAYKRAGIDIVKVVKQSVLFNFSLAKTKFALDAIYKSVGAKFLPLLTKQMDIFRAKIFANMPKIQHFLESFVKIVFKAFNATVLLGARLFSILTRVWEFFAVLDKATGGWSTKILLAIAAWKLLNLEFLATPLGLILTGLVAILALFDDFKVWQEGGQSLFDWSKFLPVINSFKEAISGIGKVLQSIADVIGNVYLGFSQLFSGDYASVLDSWGAAAQNLIGVFTNLWGVLKSVGSEFSNFGSFASGQIGKLFGGGQGGATGAIANTLGHPNAQNALGTAVQPTPLINQNGTNQHVSQETHIMVQGSADANATGKAVAGEQSKVNFDLTRNLKGATR